jgi:hypothetical protein
MSYVPAHPLLQLVVGHHIIARLERLLEMSGRERAEGEPECWRTHELVAQLVAEQQIVERNQHDPVRQTDDADDENPPHNTAYEVRRQRYRAGRFRLRLAQRARNQRGTIAASALRPSNQ